MDEYSLDAIAAPSFLAFDYPARAGYLSMTIPIGFSKAAGPLSMMIFAGHFQRICCLRQGNWRKRHRKEKVGEIRKGPYFRASSSS